MLMVIATTLEVYLLIVSTNLFITRKAERFVLVA